MRCGVFFFARVPISPLTGPALYIRCRRGGLPPLDFAATVFWIRRPQRWFDPEVFATIPAAYWATVGFRFLRLVVVVPLVEEIFWRGFLLRYLIGEKFEDVPFGKFSWISFSVVSLAFCFSHSASDWGAALITGMLYNCVAYRTKSLTSCIIAHAVTNLLLGIWIMKTGQWGFW